MANFRRRRPRTSGKYKGYTSTGWRSRHGLKPVKIPAGPSNFKEWREWWGINSPIFYPPSAPRQMDNWPRWFDIVFHTRPQRRRAAQMLRNIAQGKIDADAANWPLAKKPLIYYW